MPALRGWYGTAARRDEGEGERPVATPRQSPRLRDITGAAFQAVAAKVAAAEPGRRRARLDDRSHSPRREDQAANPGPGRGLVGVGLLRQPDPAEHGRR